MPPAGVLDSLRRDCVAALGEQRVIADRGRLLSYETDWTGQVQGTALLAVRPGSAEEAAEVLAACGRHRVGVVVQGGNTGLSGGAVPFDEVVLDTAALDEVGAVDPHSRQVTFGAGVTLEVAQARARSVGLDLGVDLAARGQATLGGMVATNAGGAMALRYGTMRASVRGLEAVLADGTIVRRLSGLPKDNAGYDLPAILIGSEGTLGVVTRARLSLVERCPERVVALGGVSSLAEAVRLVTHLRDALGPSLEAAECFDRLGLELVREHRQLVDPLPEPAPLYVLVQVAAPGAIELLAEALDDTYAAALVVAEDSERQAALWAYREGINEASSAEDVVRKYDVSVPIETIPDFVETVREEVASASPSLRSVCYGHLGDGNVHINVLGAGDDQRATVDAIVSRAVVGRGGTISAEHGIGLAKRSLLEPTRTAGEVRAMRAIKRALDPLTILAAGRVLPPDRSTDRCEESKSTRRRDGEGHQNRG